MEQKAIKRNLPPQENQGPKWAKGKVPNHVRRRSCLTNEERPAWSTNARRPDSISRATTCNKFVNKTCKADHFVSCSRLMIMLSGQSSKHLPGTRDPRLGKESTTVTSSPKTKRRVQALSDCQVTTTITSSSSSHIRHRLILSQRRLNSNLVF